MTMINTPIPTPTRPGPLTARPVDRTATTRRSRLADGQVPHLVRQVWDELTPRQRDAVIKYATAMDTWTDLTEERRAELLQAKIEKYAEDTRQAVEARTAPVTAPITSTLETRASLAAMHRAGWVVTCRECGRDRPAQAPTGGRLPSGLCDHCLSKRETSRQRARARRLAAASA